MKNNPAKGVAWDLTPLYSGIDDPTIERDIELIIQKAEEFSKNYRGRINTPVITPEEYKKILEEMIEIEEIIIGLSQFVGLVSAKDNLNEEISALKQKISELNARIGADLTWFDLERKKWSEEKAKEMIESPVLSKFKHMHLHERDLIPFVLTEKEEAILSRFSPTGVSALVKLYDKLQSNLRFEVELDGKKKNMTISEIGEVISTHADRDTRKRATEAVGKEVEKYKITNSLILNSLLLDSKISNAVRGFDYPEHAAYLDNETDSEAVSVMIAAVNDSFEISERYFKAKKKALGYNELFDWDRSIPVYTDVQRKYTWEEAKTVVLDAFRMFDEEFADIAETIIESGWVDAELTEHKTAGAFCSFGTPSSNPFVLLNFTGTITDVLALAHELGHAIHSLLSKDQSLYEFWPSTATAEVASVFSEAIVFDHLFASLDDKKEKINLLGAKIQDSIATVFIQTAFHQFEQDIHNHVLEKGELKTSDIEGYYSSRYESVYGEGITLSENFKRRWPLIGHFFHYDFYVYCYVFGELLTAALYRKYKEQGDDFVKEYKEGLALGGSKTPNEITKTMGVDITSKDFWKTGLQALEEYVKEYEELIG
ncbi:M3 family oligoendopeptidase [candidate division WWE3 bacterium]|jgi:oligoendopeptidase F|nr:M3 family oligoendopeptidase [candidate division WWE3 bacterium]MBT7350429.1 M3 family oligoendopeptidase [candidate division WWE3 bacterium]